MKQFVPILVLLALANAGILLAQQVDTLDFVIQGEELMYGDGSIDADNVIVDEAINFSLSGNTSFTASNLDAWGLKNQAPSDYGMPNLGFTFDLPGIDLSPIGGPNWSLGTWGIETVANAYAGLALTARTHVENSEVRVDYPFDLRVKIPAYNRGDLVTIEVEGRPKAERQSDASRFIDLVTPNLEKSIENAFGVGAEVGLDIYLGPFTNNSEWGYRVIDFNVHDEWTVVRAAPDGFYGGLGMIARPELSALNHELVSTAYGAGNAVLGATESAINEVANSINSALPSFSFTASPGPLDGAVEFINCFVEPDFDLSWDFSPSVPGAEFTQFEYPEMEFHIGPYDESNFKLGSSPAFYFYEDEDGDTLYYSNLCMSQMPLLENFPAIRIPNGKSRASNTHQSEKTVGRLQRYRTKPKTKKIPAWMLLCSPTMPEAFSGLLPSGFSSPMSSGFLGEASGLDDLVEGINVPTFPSMVSTAPWFTTAPQLDIEDMYGLSLTLRSPRTELLEVPRIGSDFGLSARTTNNSSWLELRHNYFDTFEAVLEQYCPMPVLPTPHCIALAGLEMRKSADNTLLQLADLTDEGGRISIWKLSTGGLGFLQNVVNALDAANCATEAVGSNPPGINNSIINFANWGLANLSDLELLNIWMEYNLFDLENKFSIQNAFKIDYNPDVQLTLAFTDSLGQPIARDVVRADGTVLTDVTSISLALNEEFQFQTECDDHRVEFVPSLAILDDPVTVRGEDIFADSLYLKLFNFDAGIDGVQIIPGFGFDFPCTGSIGEFAASLGSCAAYAIEKFGCKVLSWFGVKCKTRTKCKTCKYGFPGLRTPSWSIAKNIGRIGIDRAYNVGTTSLEYAPETTYQLNETAIYQFVQGAEFMQAPMTFDPIVMEARLFGLRGVEVRRWADEFVGENGNIRVDAEINGISDPILVSFEEVSTGDSALALQQYMSDAQSILVRQGRYQNFSLSNSSGCPADRLEEGAGPSTLDRYQVVAYIPAEEANWCSDVDNDKCNDCNSGSYDPANDGQDSDGDGLCDYGDPDDDNDGIEDANDGFPYNATLCGDKNNDGCDDCDQAEDYDGDGLCDSSAAELDRDNDGRSDELESALGGTADLQDPRHCGDADGDGCDDCTVAFDAWWEVHGLGSEFDAASPGTAIRPDLAGLEGFAQPSNDGPDFDQDGLCDSGDPDDDNDGVTDAEDASPFNPSHCIDSDGDGCNDCRAHWLIYVESRHGTWVGDQLTDSEFAAAWGDLDSLVLPNLDDLFNGAYADAANDGTGDFDQDGICDEQDEDVDSDGVPNALDAPLGNLSSSFDATRDSLQCADVDQDLCDDCALGLGADPANDGADFDGDGLCDRGDPDDDNDGVLDEDDVAPKDSLRCTDVDLDGCDDCASGTFDPLRDGPNFDWVASLTNSDYAAGVADSLADYYLEVWNASSNERLDSIRFQWVNTGVPGEGYWRDVAGWVTNENGDFTPEGGATGALNEWSVGGITFRLDTVDAGDHDSDGDGVPETLLVTEHLRPLDGDPVVHAIESVDSLPSGSAYSSCLGFVGIIVPEDESMDPDTLCGMGRRISRVLNTTPMKGLFVRYTAWSGGAGSDVTEQYNAYDGVHSTAGTEIIHWFETDQIPTVDSLTSTIDTLVVVSGDYLVQIREIPLDVNDYDASTCLDHDGDGCDDCEYNFNLGLFYEVPDVTPVSGGYWDEANDGPDYDGDGLCDEGDDDDDNDGVLDANEVPGESQNPAACGDSDGDTCDDCEAAFGLWWADHGTGSPFNAADPGVALTPDSVFFQPAHDGPDYDGDGLCDEGDDDDDNDGVLDENEAPGEVMNPAACGDSDGDTCDDCEAEFGLWWDANGSGEAFDAADPGQPIDPAASFQQPEADGTDTDADGLCDDGDQCSDVTAANWGDAANGACYYEPTVTTGLSSSVTESAATLSGTLVSTGDAPISARGFRYGTNADLTSGASAVAGTQLGTGITVDLTGLSSGTTYYYQVFGTNAAGTAYGAVEQFTTEMPN